MSQLPPGFVLDTPSAPDPIVKPRDPYKQAAEVRAQTDQSLQLDAAARAARTEQRDVSKDGLATQKTALEIDKMEREAAAGPSAQAAEGERDNAAFLRRAIGANDSYSKLDIGPRSYVGEIIQGAAPGLLNQLPEAIGNSPDRQVADANQLEFIAAILRADSGAAIPEQEIARAADLYFPKPGDSEEAIRTKAEARQRAIDGLRLSAGRLAGEVEPAQEQRDDPATPAPALSNGAPPVSPGAGGPKPLTPSTGYRQQDDPTLSGIQGEYLGRLNAKQRPGEIVEWLKSMGVTNPGVLRSAAAQAQDRLRTGRAVNEYDVSQLDDMAVPTSGADEALNAVGQTAPGAYAIGAGNFLSGNNLDSISGAMGGNAERTRAGMGAVAQQFPTATAVGEVSGGIMAAMSGEAGLARLGVGAGLGRGVAADVGMGAFNGAGAADGGNRALEAFKGAATGAAGSVAGSAAVRGASRVLAPTGGSMGELYKAGVRPTLGQRVGDKGVIGRAVNATEEALQSVPIVGAAIGGARQEARDQFQIGAFNEALKEVGEQLPKGMAPGNAPNAYAQKTFDRIYAEARNGMRMVGDEELADNMAELSEQVGTLAEGSQKRFQALLKNFVTRRVVNGELSGEAYKKAHSDIGKQIRSIRNNQSGDGELADALTDLQHTLDSAARRHSDPEAVALLDAADAGYAKLVRIEEAAKSRGGASGEFTPTQFDRSVQKTSGGTRSKAYLRGDALMQDYAEQGMGLVDKVPNSGSADRAIAATTVAGGAAYLEPSTLGFLAAIGAAYAPGGRKVMQKALAPAGPKRQAISAQLKKRARLVGSATGASAVAALPGTTPGQ